MFFNSFQYVLFLFTVYVLWWSWRERRQLRLTMVLVGSYWFYAQADWRFTSLLLISTVVDFIAGKRIDEAGDESSSKRNWMIVSLVSNLGMLGFFKYYDFFVDGIQSALASIGTETSLWHLSASQGGWLEFAVPAGISFYTFQTLSYTLDIYKGRMKPCQSWLDFAVYVSFFPQLVAGPIVRAIDFLPQMQKPSVWEGTRVSSGLFQILRGLTKKIIMADILGVYLVDVAFAHNPDASIFAADTLLGIGAPTMLLVTYAYALQLYGDFSGYSDIAIGSARLIGFELPKNFDSPFKSKSLEEFWSRWHISMSSWFQDYVYIGLGGSRTGTWKAIRNVIVAWTLVGLWHGAAWTFVLWGFYHGVWLGVVRLFRKLLPGGRFPKGALFHVLGVLFTFHVVAFSMILFRCPDMDAFMVACGELVNWGPDLRPITIPLTVIIIVGYMTHLMPDKVTTSLEGGWCKTPAVIQGAVLLAAILFFFVLGPPQAPFIYFQF